MTTYTKQQVEELVKAATNVSNIFTEVINGDLGMNEIDDDLQENLHALGQLDKCLDAFASLSRTAS